MSEQQDSYTFISPFIGSGQNLSLTVFTTEPVTLT